LSDLKFIFNIVQDQEQSKGHRHCCRWRLSSLNFTLESADGPAGFFAAFSDIPQRGAQSEVPKGGQYVCLVN
jgi:hypothetical protein